MKPGMVVHTYNPSIGEAETGGLRVPGQIGLQSKILSQKKKKKKCAGSTGDGREDYGPKKGEKRNTD
jgi:hypothetical protein